MFPELVQFSDLGLFFLRLAIAVIFIYHALLKFKNPKAMAQMLGMPKMVIGPVMLGLIELLASLSLVLGVYVQLAALLLAIIMVGAIGVKIMKWRVPFAAMNKTGWEFDLILLAANIAILLNGGGLIVLVG